MARIVKGVHCERAKSAFKFCKQPVRYIVERDRDYGGRDFTEGLCEEHGRLLWESELSYPVSSITQVETGERRTRKGAWEV